MQTIVACILRTVWKKPRRLERQTGASRRYCRNGDTVYRRASNPQANEAIGKPTVCQRSTDE